jgi:hypothetical protein
VRLERTASITSRVTSNQEALQSLSLTEVIWGKGLYRNRTTSKTYLPNHAIAPDNSFIFLFVSIGIIGCVLLLGVLFQIKPTLMSEPLASLLVLVGVHSLFNNSLFYIWTLVFLFSVSATCTKYSR